MIVEVFIAEGQSVDPLPQQVQKRVLDEILLAMIGKAAPKPFQVPIRTVHSAQQHAASVAGDVATLEIHRDRFA